MTKEDSIFRPKWNAMELLCSYLNPSGPEKKWLEGILACMDESVLDIAEQSALRLIGRGNKVPVVVFGLDDSGSLKTETDGVRNSQLLLETGLNKALDAMDKARASKDSQVLFLPFHPQVRWSKAFLAGNFEEINGYMPWLSLDSVKTLLKEPISSKGYNLENDTPLNQAIVSMVILGLLRSAQIQFDYKRRAYLSVLICSDGEPCSGSDAFDHDEVVQLLKWVSERRLGTVSLLGVLNRNVDFRNYGASLGLQSEQIAHATDAESLMKMLELWSTSASQPGRSASFEVSANAIQVLRPSPGPKREEVNLSDLAFGPGDQGS